jgi:AcrR family transcriptional regulator
MGRPVKENSLTPQDVVAVAINCLDREGEAALGVNRVARELGIKPPAIYKHLDGNPGLRRAVALSIWRGYLLDCQRQVMLETEPRKLFRASALATREFARKYPARYRVMTQHQMRPTDPDEAEIIKSFLSLFQKSLRLYGLSDNALIDAMRMVSAAIYGFILNEQAQLMTLARSTDASYEVMLDALLVSIEYIRQQDRDQ